MADKISPGMQQYLDIKADYPDAFLLFRMGDFYELFYDDAVKAAQILELTLTSRNKSSEHPVPMAGVPHHAVAEYIERLVELGYKVALADQMEDPKLTKGLVKRAVTQVVTPGTAVDLLAGAENNFLVALDKNAADSRLGLAYLDLGTGEFKVTTVADFATATGEIASLKAREVVAGYELPADERRVLEKQMHLLVSDQLTADVVADDKVAFGATADISTNFVRSAGAVEADGTAAEAGGSSVEADETSVDNLSSLATDKTAVEADGAAVETSKHSIGTNKNAVEADKTRVDSLSSLTTDKTAVEADESPVEPNKNPVATTPSSLDGLSRLTGIERSVAGKLLAYVRRTQLRHLSHLQTPVHYELAAYLRMDHATKTALELTANLREGRKAGTLYALLDAATRTAMGTRMMRAWIERPLIDATAITARQDVVAALLAHFFERADLVETLKGVYDLERLASRISFGRAVPVDLLQLAHSLGNVPAIAEVLGTIAADASSVAALTERLDAISELRQLIETAIDPDAARLITEGGIIKTGYHATLDSYREALTHGTSWIADLERRERDRTGISNLRIDYNRKDGYYFHITAAQLSHVPEHFFRKATLKNSERYGSKELSELEETMLDAREKSASLEYQLFTEISQTALSYVPRLQALAGVIAEIDCLQSLAALAEDRQYVRPQLTQGARAIDIVRGRHAVVETVMAADRYVPNDVAMPEDTDIQLITGPNMSGKSTYMRQLALIVIMAQLGAYVPAERASLPIFDAIFTRIGASDSLIAGESTFMVEMMEANRAIQQASRRSLILFDELGRGTATYDGMALAQAIIEYIHDHIHAKTLFATHYHELTALSDTLPQLTNVHVATLEKHGEVTFLHKIAAGPADKSYGIHVARIAGLPEPLLMRADIILQKLENQAPDLGAPQADHEQLSLFTPAIREPQPAIDRLEQLNPLEMTPIEALQALDELKHLL